MSDKEERIAIIKSPYCIHNKKTIFKNAMTSEEAVERMAKALFKVDNLLALDIDFEQLAKQKQLTYKFFTKEVLNALLEGK